jgi:hypothetical protein
MTVHVVLLVFIDQKPLYKALKGQCLEGIAADHLILYFYVSLTATIYPATVGMFDNVLFDNSKLIMFD